MNRQKILSNYKRNNKAGVDTLMEILNPNVSLVDTKRIDFYLGLMDSKESISRIIYYLFQGTQMQRNYSTLYLARRNIWRPINIAYRKGLIDYRQAYSR